MEFWYITHFFKRVIRSREGNKKENCFSYVFHLLKQDFVFLKESCLMYFYNEFF